MKPFRTKILFIIFFYILLVIFGCNNSDSTKTENVKTNVPCLVGIWQQTAFGGKQVSDVGVKIIFSENTLTMDAPGCLIIGDYTTADNVLTFTITSAQGQRCATDQTIGKSDSIYYTVTNSQLTMTPLLANEENQMVYKRVDETHP
jgi:hypothetical protein